jgi:hypothetical protein
MNNISNFCTNIVQFLFNILGYPKNCLQMKDQKFRKSKSIPKSHKLREFSFGLCEAKDHVY